jgi:hypothetical protein
MKTATKLREYLRDGIGWARASMAPAVHRPAPVMNKPVAPLVMAAKNAQVPPFNRPRTCDWADGESCGMGYNSGGP